MLLSHRRCEWRIWRVAVERRRDAGSRPLRGATPPKLATLPSHRHRTGVGSQPLVKLPRS